MKPEFRADYQEITPPPAARVAGAHQVERAFFTLRASTWAAVDLLRQKQNLTASQYIEKLVLQAAR